MIEARFDDLTPGAGRSFRLADPAGVLLAREPGDVPGTLEAAEGAASRGLWVGGYLAYEAAPGLDSALRVRERAPSDPFAELPLAWFALFERREEIAPLAPPTVERPATDAAWRPSVDRAAYDGAIEHIRELIAAGETYQVNHTIRLRARIAGDARGLYRDLALAQRGAFAAYLDLGRYRVLSASPELFFRIDGDIITTRPMKGTTPRGRWAEEDDEAAARLVTSAKDRAENAMIVDLLRNDLGRIARPGSVEVSHMFEPERYETVWQLTSTVSAELEPPMPLVEVFRALFPSGSVTGAPKVRTMGVIADLEDSPRGVYCGAIGYLAPSGSGEPRAHFNVAIRTVLLDPGPGTAEFGVGGGVTFDSSAEGEYTELLAKATVLTVARPDFALLETVRHDPGEGFVHLPQHLERIGASARYFGFRLDPEAVVAALKRAASEVGGSELVVRLRSWRDGSVDAEASELPARPNRPVLLGIDPDPVDPRDVWLFHKTTRRAPYDRRRHARPDVDDVILVNDRGEATESTIANLAVHVDGRWCTPPIAAGLLPGTYRAVLLGDGTLVERPITLAELRSADRVALVSSVRGWRTATIASA